MESRLSAVLVVSVAASLCSQGCSNADAGDHPILDGVARAVSSGVGPNNSWLCSSKPAPVQSSAESARRFRAYPWTVNRSIQVAIRSDNPPDIVTPAR